MNSDNRVEHYVTLFDSNFLPMGIALHESLMAHGQPFHLWILCMDEKVEEQLGRISLPNVTLMPLREIETQELLAVKAGRSRGEYCWTLTPFSFQAVFDRDDSVERVTYLDADLFFFDNPQVLLSELLESGKHVLITEHAFPPGFDRAIALNGRFCVQFLTFRRSMEALKVMRWWQEKCLEWCFARFEEGRFGDQKYLDWWPELFADDVHIVSQTEKTLAPWNVKYFEQKLKGRLDPVFYHFHGLRVMGPDRIRLYCGYKVNREGLKLYDAYLQSLLKCLRKLNSLGIAISYAEDAQGLDTEKLRLMIMRRYRSKKIDFNCP